VDLSYAAARQLDMVHVGVARVKIEFLAAPWPDHPSSQEHLPEPSAALIYEAQQRNRRGVGPWEDIPRFNRELRAFVESR